MKLYTLRNLLEIQLEIQIQNEMRKFGMSMTLNEERARRDRTDGHLASTEFEFQQHMQDKTQRG